MDKSFVWFFVVICCLGLASAVSVSTASYSVDSSNLGSAGGEISTTSFEGRNSNVYDGAGTRNVTSLSYSANSGWLYVLSMILSGNIDDENAIMELLNTILSFISRGSWCAPGYEKIDGQCVRIPEVKKDIPPERQLFDISWILLDSSIRDASELVGVLSFESFGNIATPVSINFVVLDSSDNKIYDDNFSIIVMTEEVVRWDFVGNGMTNLTDGDYIAIANTLYDGNVSDEFRQEFRVSENAGFSWYWFLLIIPLVILVLVIFILKRNRLMKSRALIKKSATNLTNTKVPVVVNKVPTTNIATSHVPNKVVGQEVKPKVYLSPVREMFRKLAQAIQHRYSNNSLSNKKGVGDEQIKKGII